MKTKYLITVMFGLLLDACTDYLDIQPYGQTIPKTAEEFSALVHSLLDDVDQGNSILIPNIDHVTDWDCGSGDDFEVCLTEPSGRSLNVYQGSNLNNANVYAPYSSLYSVIRDCNIVIGNLKEENTDLGRNTLAAAYAMRGVAYYELMRYYCEAPRKGELENQLGVSLVTVFDMEERPVRSNLQATADLIESDLEKSISYHCTDNLFRFTEDVAEGYLARLYFWTEQWDKALPICEELLVKHPLVDAKAFLDMMNHSYVLDGNKLVMSHRLNSAETYSIQTSVLQYRPVSTRFLDCFTEEEKTSDVRYALSVNRKRKVQKSPFCGFRAAELQLIKAESLYHLGQQDKALEALNFLRSKRITPYTPLTMQTLPAHVSSELITVDCEGNAVTPLISAILRERRKELFLEGSRLWELKRNGTPEFWTAYNGRKYTTLPYMYTWPVPESDIRINPDVLQNPGYTELVSN